MRNFDELPLPARAALRERVVRARAGERTSRDLFREFALQGEGLMRVAPEVFEDPTTHTVAELQLSPTAYVEIRQALEAAGYQHAIGSNGMIDMTGIGITCTPQRRIMLQERSIRDTPLGAVTKVRRSKGAAA